MSPRPATHRAPGAGPGSWGRRSRCAASTSDGRCRRRAWSHTPAPRTPGRDPPSARVSAAAPACFPSSVDPDPEVRPAPAGYSSPGRGAVWGPLLGADGLPDPLHEVRREVFGPPPLGAGDDLDPPAELPLAEAR